MYRHVHVSVVSEEVQKRELDSPGTRVMSSLIWVLETDFRSSPKAGHILKHGATSPALTTF